MVNLIPGRFKTPVEEVVALPKLWLFPAIITESVMTEDLGSAFTTGATIFPVSAVTMGAVAVVVPDLAIDGFNAPGTAVVA